MFNNHKVDVSDVPCDSLNGLIMAMRKFVAGSEEEEVEWSLEPGYEKWYFERENDATCFRIVDGRGIEVLLVTNGISLVSNIVEKLGDLQNKWKDDPEYRNWSWDFPSELLDKLREELKSN